MDKLKNTTDKVNKFLSRYGILLFVVSAIIVSSYYGIERIFNVDFVCTNGDYQNYNVLRRFLDGQVPYKDFTNYLGMGLLILCAPLLSLHNNFAGNLFVTNMVASFAFILFVTVIFYLVTGNKKVSCFAGLLFPKLVSSDFLLGVIPVYGYYTDYYLGLLAYPNNSFRIGRMFWPIILCLISIFFIYAKKDKKNNSLLRFYAATPKGATIIGFITGIGMTWSNDFGFCCIGSVFLIMFILTIADKYQREKGVLLWKRFMYFFPALFIGMFLSIVLASQGNIGRWFDFTFGVGDWQYTYFGRRFDDKYSASLITLFTLKQLKRTRIHLLIYFTSMMYCLYKLCKDKANDRIILYVFLFTSVIASHMFYILGSGGDGFTEGTYGLVIISFWAMVTRFIYEISKKVNLNRYIDKAILLVTVIYIGFMYYSDISIYKQYKNENITRNTNYVAELGGITSYAEDLRRMDTLVADDTLFSTYATALEDIRDEYQPTGSDYVIHALGNKKYTEYVNDFISQKYKWVQTTNYYTWPWEIWTSKASWELYKEIYSNYTLNSNHGYWTMWKYAGENYNVINPDITISIEQINEGTVSINVQSKEKRPCYVDVELNWTTERLDNIHGRLALRELVFVEDIDSAFYKDDKSAGYFLKKDGVKNIPIYMEEGKGQVILRVVPENALSLQINSVQYNEVILKQM